MTTATLDVRGSEWLLKEEWGFSAKPSAEEFDSYAKSLLICAKGDGVLAPEELDWILGYMTACGASQDLVDEMTRYPADENVADVLSKTPVASASRAGLVFDAIRASAADGVLAPEELATIRTMADHLGVGNLVDQLKDLYNQEKGLRDTRNALIFPNGQPI